MSSFSQRRPQNCSFAVSYKPFYFSVQFEIIMQNTRTYLCYLLESHGDSLETTVKVLIKASEKIFRCRVAQRFRAKEGPFAVLAQILERRIVNRT